MWMSGGGGAFWTIDAKTKVITVSLAQTFGGRDDEGDGNGPLAYRIEPYVHIMKGCKQNKTGARKTRRMAA